jgi:hypothetical protein
MSRIHHNQVTRTAHSQRPRYHDPEFAALAAMCRRLIHEKAELEARVEKLEAELADYARDEQARQLAEREEAELQMRALADEAAEWAA